MRDLKYQTFTETIANGSTTSNITLKNVTLDHNYERCIGIRVIPHTTHTLRLGISTQAGLTIQDITHMDDYIASTGVAHKDRYKEINIPAKGNTINYTVRPYATLTADQSFDIVFILENRHHTDQ